MSSLRIKLLCVLSLLLISLFISSVYAQSYDGAVTTNVAIASSGTSTVTDNFGVTYIIQGTAGSTGTVTTDYRSANPQATAKVPEGVSLTRFVVVTFNIAAADFTQAQIIIPYTDSDVEGVQSPYAIFKYNPATDSYSELAASQDTAAKTFTFTVTSIDDPLFAIGGASVLGATGGISNLSLAVLISSIIVIVVLVVFGVWYFKKRD